MRRSLLLLLIAALFGIDLLSASELGDAVKALS
jgi:hypothetical protein